MGNTAILILPAHHRLRSIVTRKSLLPPPGSREDPQWRQSWDYLCRVYTPAMIRYVRCILQSRLGRPVDYEEAADVVHDYLTQAIEKNWLSRDGERIRCFRAYLQTQLARYTGMYLRKKHAQKRWPKGTESSDLLDDLASDEVHSAIEELDAGWMESITDHALARLRHSNRTYHAVIVDLLHTEGAGSQDLKERLGRPQSRVKDLRHRARRRFAVLLFEELRKSVRDEEAYESLFGRLQPYLP